MPDHGPREATSRPTVPHPTPAPEQPHPAPDPAWPQIVPGRPVPYVAGRTKQTLEDAAASGDTPLLADTQPRPADDTAAGQPDPPSALVVYLTDPKVQAAIDAFVATAPPLTEAQRIRLARLLRTDQCARRGVASP